jgi:hypothetical protein
MSAVNLPLARPTLSRPSLLAIGLIALSIALIGPFDRAVDLASGGLPLARMGLIAALVLAGSIWAGEAGLALKGTTRSWLVISIGSAFAVAVYVSIVDGFLFRAVLPPTYVNEFRPNSLNARLAYYFLRAFQENVIYRLFVFSGLMLSVSRLRGQAVTEFPSMLVWTIAFATQFLNVAINVMVADPFSGTLFAYDIVRFVVPGTLWGWLYWRHGFVTIEVAHVACHAFLQPALGVLV